MKKNDDANSDLSWFSNAASENTVNLPEQNNGKKTILIVDDEKLVRDVWNRFLSRQDYHVIESENGEEAVELFRQQNKEIDLIILDMNMPGMGGIQCLNELQKINPDAPILISSGYFGESEAEIKKKHSTVRFVPKPIELKKMSLIVRQILDEK